MQQLDDVSSVQRPVRAGHDYILSAPSIGAVPPDVLRVLQGEASFCKVLLLQSILMYV